MCMDSRNALCLNLVDDQERALTFSSDPLPAGVVEDVAQSFSLTLNIRSASTSIIWVALAQIVSKFRYIDYCRVVRRRRYSGNTKKCCGKSFEMSRPFFSKHISLKCMRKSGSG